MAEKHYHKLLEVIDGLEKQGVKKIAIEMQDTPDPDSMGCGLLLKYILNKRGTFKVDITHANPVDDPRNHAMLAELNLNDAFVKYKNGNGEEKLPDYDGYFFVDHSGATSVWYKEGKIPAEKIYGVIDHHEKQKENGDKTQSLQLEKIAFVDIQSVGACSTIMTGYLIEGMDKDVGIELEKNKEFETIATALLLGIRADTTALTGTNVTPADRDATEFLKKYVDADIINKIEKPKLDRNLIKVISRTLNNLVSENEVMIAFAGHITSDQHMALTHSAEFLLNTKGIMTVYAVGIQPTVIDVAIRNEDKSYNFDKLKQLFPEAISCGGRTDKTAGGLKLTNFFKNTFLDRNDEERRKAIEDIVFDEFKKRLFPTNR